MLTSESIDKKYLLSLINKRNPVIMDIGCYDGQESLEFLSLANESYIFAFDPLPEVTGQFKQLLSSNKNLKLVETALGNVDEYVSWHISYNHPASSSLKAPKDHLSVFQDIQFSEISNIKCSKLDTWAKNNLKFSVVDLLWVDVNGAEREFLEGAVETISKRVNYIFIEFSGVGEQKLFKGSFTKNEILSSLDDFEELGVYDFLGNYGNLLLKRRNLKK
jgi:FkbM family methyltransferase